MNRIINFIIINITAVSFIACGGNNTVEGFNGNSFEKINIDKACTSPDTVDTYITLKSGDQIVQDTNDANISILHDQNGLKKICLQSGTAHINRAYTE